MRRTIGVLMAGIGLVVGSSGIWAHEQPAPSSTGEQTLSGEVVDVTCYLEHPKSALGPGHADCAKKCITSGLPVAIKVGSQLYLATKADHTPANALLAPYAGQQVEVHGTVMERDGQHLIAVSKVEKAR